MDIVRRLSRETSPTFVKLWAWGTWVITSKCSFVVVWLRGFSAARRGLEVLQFRWSCRRALTSWRVVFCEPQLAGSRAGTWTQLARGGGSLVTHGTAAGTLR